MKTYLVDLCGRIAKSSAVSPSARSFNLALLRPGSYRNWKDSKGLQEAIEIVQRGELPLRRAAELYGVPKSTLHDRVVGKVKSNGQSGPEPYLCQKEEEELINFLIGCCRIGVSQDPTASASYCSAVY